MNLKLAAAAQDEARKNYHGNTDAAIGNLQPLADLFAVADDVNLETLNADWSGAFAYLCTEKAGLGLPVRYPDPRVHSTFANVRAWFEYARLPKIHLWRAPDEPPEIGDLVILEAAERTPDLMGIVVAVYDTTVDIAIGNYHNHSAIVEKPLDGGIVGYIRIEEV